MIFTVSSVCLAYLLGIVVSTFYIRSLALVGAGFFWLLASSNTSLAFFGIISSTGNVKILCSALFFASCAHLTHTIMRRKSIREKTSILENALIGLVGILVVATLIVIAQKDFSGFALVRESARLIVGGLVLGGVTSAMLLGHWYLVQPGLTRKPIGDMCSACMYVLIFDIALWLISPSMISVIRGTISDGWGGTLGYMWLGSCITTAVLLYVARKALQEKSYSAVMATTGLLYLAILTANGVELIPRAIFS